MKMKGVELQVLEDQAYKVEVSFDHGAVNDLVVALSKVPEFYGMREHNDHF